jgi:nucleotide-binding universal stress UspA family protein
MNVQHILAAADESEAGRQAVRSAIDLARRADARATVVRAVPVMAMAVAATTTGGYDSAGAEIQSPAIEELRQWIGSDLRAQSEPPLVELAIVSGIPGMEIRRLAEQRKADLVVPSEAAVAIGPPDLGGHCRPGGPAQPDPLPVGSGR